MTDQYCPQDAEVAPTALFALATEVIDIAEHLRRVRAADAPLDALDLEQIEVSLRTAVREAGVSIGEDFPQRVQRARLALLRDRIRASYRRMQGQLRTLNDQIAEIDAQLGRSEG